MEDLLIETLNTFGYPVRLQGSLAADEEYPPNFFTFWNDNSDSDSFYDDDSHSTIYSYNINFYSNDPVAVYTVLSSAIVKLKAVGFIIDGDGFSVPSDEQSHTGRGIDAVYKKGI